MNAKEKDFTQEQRTIISEIMEGSREAYEHPSYSEFVKKYMDFSHKDETHIRNVWDALIEGYRIQFDRAQLAMDMDTNEEYLATINDNRHFKNAVAMIQRDAGLAVPEEKELALWSGGYELSLQIRNLGMCPLEETPFGNLLDTLKVTWEWKREGGLWNILSAAFVGGYERGRRAHIYFRIVDEMSVLYVQELPMLMRDADRIIVMHPIYQQGTQAAEVGYDRSAKRVMSIGINKENCVFAYKAREFNESVQETYDALTEMLGRESYTANKIVYLNYRSDKFKPGHAPFAREGEPTSGYGSQKEAKQKFWKK